MKKPKAKAFGFFTPVLWWGGAWACGWGLPDCGLSAGIVLKRPLLKAPEDICIIPLARFLACRVWPNIWCCSCVQRNHEEQDGKGDYRHALQQFRSHAGDKPCEIEVHFTLGISSVAIERIQMKAVLLDREILMPNLGLALISMAALIQLMSLNPMPSLAKEAADQFSIGVPLMVGTAFLPRLRDNEHVGVRQAIGFLNVFFILGGVVSCLVGLSKCFKLVSPQAAEYFSGACILIGGISVANYLYTSYLRKQRVLSKSDT